jgi:kynurenine formamidase
VLLRWYQLFTWLGMDQKSGLTWALSIIMLVVTARLLLFRFFVKQVHYQRRMQEIQPKIKKLQEKHKGDKATLPLDYLVNRGVVVDISSKMSDWAVITPDMIESAGADIREGDILILHTGWHRHYEGQSQQDLVKYFCYHPGPNLDTLHWMLEKKIKWWGMDTGSCDHAMNTSIRTMRPDLAAQFTKLHGKTPGEFFGTFEYIHKKSKRRVVADVFPFHNWAFQEGLLHAENLGGDIELMLNKRALIGAFPWRYEGLEGCPCRIVAFLDAGDNVEAVGNAAKAIMGA